ncbi:YVTN repeat-like/Quino protein amine dehydrogenase [Ramicandelaber brevisporus]|nr:YVTN repeat-like/Quino protein amine dehydrogenase [Ramicandelaber brevisporus]
MAVTAAVTTAAAKVATTAAIKRAATESATASRKSQSSQTGSRVFVPFRAIGYVSNNVPFALQARGTAHFLTTCVGSTFHVYDIESLNLLFVGSQLNGTITSILPVGDLTYAAVDGAVVVLRRALATGRVMNQPRDILDSNNNGASPIFSLLQLGTNHVVGLAENSVLSIWESSTGNLASSIDLNAGSTEDESSEFTASAIVHPATYINKVIVGSLQGRLQLWNIKTRTLVYEFAKLSSPITCLVQAPAIDIIAIGQLDGTITLFNAKLDTRLFDVHQSGKVTAITFRTDGPQIMATANASGDIVLWDLEKRKSVQVMTLAHEAMIPSIQFLVGQPVLVSSGADNSIKEWIFDTHDGAPRLLKSRSGHAAPPTMVRYYGSDGKAILSAGRDSAMRMFSVVRDSRNVELSQGAVAHAAKRKGTTLAEMRLPMVTQFAASATREKDWENLVTCHRDSLHARAWSTQRGAISSSHTPFKTRDSSIIRAVAVSGCGNYGFVGSTAGRIEMFNMQSGHFRRAFVGHTKVVTALGTDRLSRRLVSCSLDATLRIWDLGTGKELHKIDLPGCATSLVMHSHNELVAVVCDDMCIYVFDIDTVKRVRRLVGHRNRITDLAYSPDGRWVVSASLDGTVRTWDLPTGHLIDVFSVPHVATSVSFSPTGDYLATAHVDQLGVFLWANKAQFTAIPLQPISAPERLVPTALPLIAQTGDDDDGVLDVEDGPADLTGAQLADQLNTLLAIDSTYRTAADLADDMIKLSGLPKSRWLNLLKLEQIKKRNKPKQPPKKPEAAPFFLYNAPVSSDSHGVSLDYAGLGGPESSLPKATEKRIIDLGYEQHQAGTANASKGADSFEPFFSFVKTLGPSAINFEIRSMGGFGFGDTDGGELMWLLTALAVRLEQGRDYELVNSYLGTTLAIHGDILAANPENFLESLQQLSTIMEKRWEDLERLIQKSVCLLEYHRS